MLEVMKVVKRKFEKLPKGSFTPLFANSKYGFNVGMIVTALLLFS